MLSPGEDVEITSLRKRGWSISAIARHVGHDRKTVRGYLSGEREPGVRERAEPDPFDRFEPYVRQRLSDDRHVWATVLFDEVAALGYARSYQTFTRQLRDRALRPHCEPCSSSNGRAHVDIDHPPGEEIQWDWLELDDNRSPPHWSFLFGSRRVPRAVSPNGGHRIRKVVPQMGVVDDSPRAHYRGNSS